MVARVSAESHDLAAGDPIPPRSAVIVQHQSAQAGRLAQFLVHELNNQLTGILGFAQVLQLKLEGRPEIAQLDRIVAAGEKMQRLIEQYREVTHPRLESEPVSMSLALQTVLESRRYEIEKRNIVLVVDVKPGLATLTANPARVYAALGALIDNAYEALREAGGGTLNIAARVDDDGATVIEIWNSAGAPPARAQPWQTTKDPRLHAGVGLAAACWIADSMGARCTIRSHPSGNGVLITWRLPAAA